MMTYRYRGHSMSDPAKYRTREEVQKMRDENDPIDKARARILEKGFATEDELKAMDLLPVFGVSYFREEFLFYAFFNNG